MANSQLPLFDDVPPKTHVVNVASVPQRSVFRYPGGKTWFVPYARRWLGAMRKKPALLVEPFAGGGIVGLTAVFEGLSDHVLLVELDSDVAAVWETLLSDDAIGLAEQIKEFTVSVETVRAALESPPSNRCEQAFQTILRNRVNRGGILAPGAGRVKTGESGKGMNSRWYPATLHRRILDIYAIRDRITFIHDDGLTIMRQHINDNCAVYFLDPPYTAGGKRAGARLYRHWSIDHEALFMLAAQVESEFVMTYDAADEVRSLAEHRGFQHRNVSMKNTHHAQMSELIISRDLSWL